MRVIDNLCVGCEACLSVCPNNAIKLYQGRAWIDSSLCGECGACAEICPQGAIKPARDITKTTAQEQSALSPSKFSQMIVKTPDGIQEKRKSPLYSVVSFLSREILPCFIDALVDRLDDHQNTQLIYPTKVPLSRQIKNPSLRVSNQPLRHRHRFSRRKMNQNPW
ncbi:MAG: hypothetical protein DDG59_14785 [Anaerolineae bacterium]|jgi:NAD-dependent dihydropyrimidine dehydrogenase PreA subunit|nr:MAG: hypothetical protein DDG59_14785 [Anaerolineae bacterium]